MGIVNHVLRVAVGLVFILSGLAKLYPIEPFEIIFVDFGITNWLAASIVARLVITFEIFLGLSIIFNFWVKNIIYYLTQGVLVFFTIYLLFLLITEGNDVDCGCFGSFLALTPIQSIIKNLILIVILLFVKRNYHSFGLKFMPIIFIAIAAITTFSLNTVGLHNLQGVEVNEKIDYSELPSLYSSKEKVDFSEGNKMVAFVTWTCPHCKNAARKFVSLNNQKKISNLYFVVGSKKEPGLLEFKKETKHDFPTIWMKDDEFFKYSGGRLPAIVYLENGVIKKKWFGDLFDVEDISQYFEN